MKNIKELAKVPHDLGEENSWMVGEERLEKRG